MRAVRWVLVACLTLAVGCTSGDPATEPSESESPFELSQASQTPSPVATSEPATEAPTEIQSEAPPAEPASALFTDKLPKRHDYAPLPENARRLVATQLGGIEDDPIISDVATRYVERGSAPVAAIIGVRFSAQATPADLEGFTEGVTQGTGGSSKTVQVGGKDVMFIKAQNSAFLYTGDDFALLFFGASRADLEPVVAAIVRRVD